MKKQAFYILTVLLIIAVLAAGCETDTEYKPPRKVEPASNDKVIISGSAVAVPSEPKTKKEEPPKIQIFKVGDTATDNELKVTLNNVRFTSRIDEQNNEFLVANAPHGKEYLIVDMTVENALPDKTQSVSTLIETTVVDQDGYNYNLDFGGLVVLDKSFKDGEILPGMKKRGELAYLVPSDATDLKFIYDFDLFSETSVVFDIK